MSRSEHFLLPRRLLFLDAVVGSTVVAVTSHYDTLGLACAVPYAAAVLQVAYLSFLLNTGLNFSFTTFLDWSRQTSTWPRSDASRTIGRRTSEQVDHTERSQNQVFSSRCGGSVRLRPFGIARTFTRRSSL